jgi:hypothetical protein
MFCTPGVVFDGTEGVSSCFHVLCSRTHFRRYRGRQIPFSCFCCRTHFRRYRGRRLPFPSFSFPDSFSAIPRASSPIFMFCAPRLIFRGIEGVSSRFHVMYSRTRFRRYRGRRFLFTCFALPNSFSRVPRASGPVFIFCAPGHVFRGTEGVGSRFNVLLS